MKNKLLKTILVIMLITALTMADFILLGMNLVTYAFENVTNNTEYENVKYSAYFKTEKGTSSSAKYEINNSEMKLHIEVEVENAGSLENGKITLAENSNFIIKPNQKNLSKYIIDVNQNTITLNTLRAGDIAEIELDIEPKIEEKYVLEMLSKDTEIKLVGDYKESTEETKTSLKATKKVSLTLLAPSDLNTTLRGEVITNKVSKIGEETKRIVQLEINSAVVNNAYPIKTTNFAINLPERVEQVEVVTKGTYATSGEAERKIENYNWDKTNKLLEVSIQNKSENGKVAWNKDAIDNIIVTLILDDETEIKEEYNAKAIVEFYGETTSKESNITYNLTEEKEKIVEVLIQNKEEIYKGKIYSSEEREYKTTTNIIVNYAILAEGITVNEETSYLASSAMGANIQYKTTTINKSELQKILGNEGILTIKDGQGNIVEQISKEKIDSIEDDGLIIEYNSDIKTIQIEISKTAQTGILRLNHTKVIKEENSYKEEQLEKISNLLETATLKYSLPLQAQVSEHSVETKTPLHEVTSESTLTIGQKTIVSEQNNEVPITITLKTDEEKYKLFNNPRFELTMPEGITVNSVSKGEISATNEELAISKIETDNLRKIIIEIKGKQAQYITSNINTQINFTANVSLEKMIPNRVDRVSMIHTNGGKSGIENEQEIELRASNSEVVTHIKLENYNGQGAVIEKYSDNQTEVQREIPLENTTTIKVPVTYTIINNYDTEISITETISANYTNKAEDTIELLNYVEGNATIAANAIRVVKKELEIPAGLYYSENIDIQTLVEYTYSGTEYNVKNGIELKTENKEGIRDISVIDEKLQVETFAQLGNGTSVKEEDLVYNEQIIQYIIEVTNISNKTISNLKLTNKQDNGRIYDLKEVEVINEVVSDKILIEHRYAELEDAEKTFTIESLKSGESIELLAKVVVKKVAPNNITTANISVSADGIQNKQIQTISNKVKDSNLKITTQKALNEEVTMYGKGQIYILTDIENLTDKQIKNVKGKIYLSDGLTFPEKYELQVLNEEQGYLDTLQNVKYKQEENYIEYEITSIESKQLITVSASLYIKAIPLEQTSRDEIVYCDINNIISNSVEAKIEQLETAFSVEQTTNIKENQKVKDNEIFTITGKITNIGYVGAPIYIEDYIEPGLEIVNVELIEKGETKDLTSDVHGKNIIAYIQLNPKENVTIKIKVKVNTSQMAAEEIANKIAVTGATGDATYSNEVIIQIDSNIVNNAGKQEPELKPDTENIDPENKYPESEENNGNGEGENNGENSGGENNQEEKTFVISGYAWVDKNQNDTRDANEAIQGVSVKIIDLKNQNMFVKNKKGSEIEVKTDKNGFYQIEGLPKGNYDLIFIYDTSLYELKENSNLEDYIIESTNQKVAITNNINLDKNINIDISLMELKEFNLKIDKYISKVIVQTANGTKTTGYSEEQLVREEIQKKYLSGATVLVEYTMQITNAGELSGYATEIIDYMPNDMKFYSELNTQWYEGEDGNLYNTTLASTTINPGETKTIKLILSKTMTKENTGTTSNVVEITKTMNSKQYKETSLNDNQSKAEIIINPATGTVLTYLIAILNSIVIVVIGLYMIKKKIVGKG